MPKKKYFQGLSEKTKEVNCILEGIYNFSFTDFSEDKRTLNDIVNELTSVRENFRQIDLFEYKNNETDLVRKKLDSYEHDFDNYLENIIYSKNSELEDTLKSIYDSRNNLEVLKSLRKKADSIDDYINLNDGVLDIASSRNIYCPEIFSDYSSKRKQIDNLNKEISLINERYKNFLSSSYPEKELKSLLKATKTKGIFKTQLYKDCKKSGYYEGIISLSNTNKNIKLLLDKKIEYSFVDYTKKENKIIQRAEKIYSDESEKFCLTSLLKSVGFPEDSSYLRLMDTLNGKYSADWSKRLSKFSDEIKKITLTESGRKYLYQIKECLEIAQEQRQYLNEINLARTAIDFKLTA